VNTPVAALWPPGLWGVAPFDSPSPPSPQPVSARPAKIMPLNAAVNFFIA
jgi:hypothetical protein